MAAEAVIAIRALDLTRQVFASIQRSLSGLQSAVGKAGAALGGFLTFTIAKRALIGFNNALRDVEKESEKFGATQEEVDKVTRATGFLDSMMKTLKMGVVNAVNGVLDLKDALTGVSQVQSGSIADKIRADRDAPKIKELKKDIEEMRRELEAVGETPSQHFGRLAEEIKRMNAEAKDPAMSDALDKLNKEKAALQLSIDQRKISIKIYEDYVKSVEQTTEATQAFYEKQMTAEEQQIALGSSIQRLVKEIDALNSTLGDNFMPEIATQEELAKMEKLIELQEKYRQLLAKREVLETTMQKIGRQSGEIIAQSLEDAVFAGQKLSEVLRSLSQDLLRMAFREAVTAPLGTGLGSFFKNLFRAEGGPVGSGSPYIVGERGPELFVPRSSGSIVSNDRLAGASFGGGGVNITYNIASGVSRAELMPILDTERKRLKAEIPDMVRRGGAYRAAFA
jgi:hypothetical protein